MEEKRSGVSGVHWLATPQPKLTNEHNSSRQKLSEQRLVWLGMPSIQVNTLHRTPEPKTSPNVRARTVPHNQRLLCSEAPLLPWRLISASVRAHSHIPEELAVHEGTGNPQLGHSPPTQANPGRAEASAQVLVSDGEFYERAPSSREQTKQQHSPESLRWLSFRRQVDGFRGMSARAEFHAE